MPADTERITVPKFIGLKAAGRKITMLTAYDYPMAALVDAAGIEGILVGDSMSMVVQGHATTLPVTLDEMIYHAEMVGRAVQRALVVVDMPFPTTTSAPYKADRERRANSQGDALPGGEARRGRRPGRRDRALVSAGIP